MYEATEWWDIRQTAMLSPTVTELTRGTAHPESQASRIMVALSLEPEPAVANSRRVREAAPAPRHLRRRHASHTSDPAQWRGLQAA
jgi:hypothetical protein